MSAIENLAERGYEVELVQDFDLDAIRALLQHEQPVVAIVEAAIVGDHYLAHAVVLCGVSDDALVVMDPLVGDYVSLPIREAELRLARDFTLGLIVAGSRPA